MRLGKVILSPVLLGAAGGQRGEAGHEEVEAGEGNHVDRQLAQVSVELAGEPEAGGHTGHGEGDQVVEVAVGGGGDLEAAAAHLEERLVVHAEHAVAVLQQLVQGEARVVRLRHGVGHLLTRHHRPG